MEQHDRQHPQDDDRRTRSRSPAFVLPLVAIAASVFALVLLLSSGVGARLDVWHFRTGFTLLKFAAYCGLGCALLAVVTGVIAIRRRHHAGVLLSAVALLVALFAFGLPYSWKLKSMNYPRIHDITTDVNTPPRFVATAPLRGDRVNYEGAAVAAKQLQAYPDLKTVVLPLPQERAFNAALEAAREMGWQVVATVPEEGRIEATATTKWFAFKDDVVIRITPAGERSLVDVRSASRVGISDLGTNARRIREYLAKLTHQDK
jgi:uncharacterized protein (DUF1499 family)